MSRPKGAAPDEQAPDIDPGDANPAVSGLFDQVEEVVATISRQLRERNLTELLTEAELAARRNPVSFLAGSAVAGFLLAQMLTRPTDAAGK